jgi:DNA-binding LacI/PurR family transcriptional regulator
MATPFTAVEIGTREIAHRVITDRMRQDILSDRIKPGTEFPSTAKLAETWKTSMSTMHIALKNLVKEGLLERRHGSGTYVRERRSALDVVGIYIPSTLLWSVDESAFRRSVVGHLEHLLSAEGIKVRYFVERRPEIAQRVILPELRRAIDSAEIQGLIIIGTNAVNLPALLKVPVPLSVMTAAIGVSSKVGFDSPKDHYRESLRRLYAKGCRSVGFLASARLNPRSALQSEVLFFVDDFIRQVEACRMTIRPEWISHIECSETEGTQFGYDAFHHLWHMKNRPDALVVIPDIVVRGVILAALELGIHKSRDMEFCFYRNAHIPMYCPFPSLWAVADEREIAAALIKQISLQHAGQKVSPLRCHYRFEDMPSLMGQNLSQRLIDSLHPSPL